jgi:DNA polymerase-3 subunit delta'
MRLSEIVGQPRAVGALEQAIESGRIVPSLIFYGPEGVGKLATAVALCRALLCGSAEPPCRDCATCRRIDERALMHPDIRVIFPERVSDFEKGAAPTEGAAGVDLQDRQTAALRNPAWTVLIGRVRQSIDFLQRRPAEGRRSMLIVDQAHRMGSEAANALLPTIRSRCQSIPFQQVPAAEIAAFLASHHSLDPEESSLRAGLSDGRIGAAIDLDIEEFRSRREKVLRVLENLLNQGDPGLAVARAEEITRGGQPVEQSLELLMTLARDLMIIAAAGESAPGLIHVDLLPRLRALAGLLDPEAPRCIRDLDRTLDAIRHRGNRQLLVENFLLDLVPRSAPSSRHPS